MTISNSGEPLQLGARIGVPDDFGNILKSVVSFLDEAPVDDSSLLVQTLTPEEIEVLRTSEPVNEGKAVKIGSGAMSFPVIFTELERQATVVDSLAPLRAAGDRTGNSHEVDGFGEPSNGVMDGIVHRFSIISIFSGMEDTALADPNGALLAYVYHDGNFTGRP